ncbi:MULTISPECIES: multidrug effflux MFS transporter [unclassified Myroides]|uniref:multidrug effflux MFS transporter n=1 Tax=unclassified Myroides TaxID=2642485 RepID=UPI0015F8255A|nr:MULTISPECIES: multidrug effflux MFS transporter [unclassified Myroides]MBB1148977.1 multidrug effflux MFS transporter [Myroides sp. NP-2]MDM1408162.1 multidrug effflux MFS transporter [Myroides sp. DF42-4-2]
MKTKLQLGFMVVLMMFPQFVETIYSPALPSITQHFQVSETQALLTISTYFIAFAFGVICWGILSDYIGRRKAMICGLTTYMLASMLALLAPSFEVVLIARIIAAFGIAVGSVITQTMMRDVYTGAELSKVFSIMGIALSISPVLGLLLGGVTVSTFEHYGVFFLLAALALIVVIKAYYHLPETKQTQEKISRSALFGLAKKMYTDRSIWRFALLVMSYNVLLFSYYSFAPFIFESNGYDASVYGYSGVVLALGSFAGSYFNKICLSKGILGNTLILGASILALASAMATAIVLDSMWFLVPVLLIVAAFGIAIPNILSQALVHYKTAIGSAGALFGLLYYLLIGLGLYVSSLLPHFGWVLLLFAGVGFLLAIGLPRKK